jgi:predicted amidohydrolase
MREPLNIAVAQPECAAGDVAGNAARHALLVRAARARVVVFPELSLTGYELADAPVVDPGDENLSPLRRACADAGCVALAGAPVAGPGKRPSIGVLAISASGVEVAYRKLWLSTQEAARFDPGSAPRVLEVDRWRLGLAVCKDTGTPEHVLDTARMGIDLYAAGLVMHPDERDEQERRARSIAEEFGVCVAFASFAGPTGSGYEQTAGCSGIWDRNATMLANAGPTVDRIARAKITELIPARLCLAELQCVTTFQTNGPDQWPSA